jgi:hypothetical protein
MVDRMPLPDPTTEPRRRTTKRHMIIATGALLATAAAVVAFAPPALAAGPAAPSLSGVIDSLRLWMVSILAGLATLLLTIGGILYLTAAGDPAKVERAKSALKSAAIGYALAALAPVAVAVLQSIAGH